MNKTAKAKKANKKRKEKEGERMVRNFVHTPSYIFFLSFFALFAFAVKIFL
jgi:hypothetical protein